MQSLGLSDSTPRSEGRLKALFWPSIQNETDVDYLGQQGLWICLLAALLAGVTGLFRGGIFFAFSAIDVVFFVLAGMGIRERNQHAATAVFVAYTLSIIAAARLSHQFPGIPAILMSALLLANVRGTWLAATSNFSREAFDQDRLSATFLDKLTDQWPRKIWPVLQWLFWILFAIEILITAFVLALPFLIPFIRMARHH